MTFYKFIALILTTSFLGACTTADPQRNLTALKSSFLIKGGEKYEKEITVKHKDKFLERDLQLQHEAILKEKFSPDATRPSIIIPKGTVLIGAAKLKNAKGGWAMQNGKPVKTDKNYELNKFLLSVKPQITKEMAKTEVLKLSINDRKKHLNEYFKKLFIQYKKNDAKRVFYCFSIPKKLKKNDFWLAGLSLGTSLLLNPKDSYCFQDKDINGDFDTLWRANMNQTYPPAITSVYDNTPITPVAYNLPANSDKKNIGSIWLVASKQGFFNKKLAYNVRMGNGDKFIEFDNMRQLVDLNTSDLKKDVFGASFELIEYDKKSNTHKLKVISSGKDRAISTKRTVTYSTQYIPIFISR